MVGVEPCYDRATAHIEQRIDRQRLTDDGLRRNGLHLDEWSHMKLSRIELCFAALAPLAAVCVLGYTLTRGMHEDSRKICAESLVVISTAQECSMMDGCMMTMRDLHDLNEAQATRQNVCPRDDNPSANN